MKLATDIYRQIELLKERGIVIDDIDKAKEILLDIGYYRLGFYLFPFEETYPRLHHRTHKVKDDTKLSDAVTLYYFDFDVRNILMRYICRIEVAIRTYLIYTLSNRYVEKPLWFVDEDIVDASFKKSFDRHYEEIRKNRSIKYHHRHYKEDRYAPAWKTLEFMTLGGILELYKKLNSNIDKMLISKHFGINQTRVFENYMEAIRHVRNICAHGGVLYDARLPKQLRKGPTDSVIPLEDGSRVGGAIKVIAYMLARVSSNRLHEMVIQLNEAYRVAVKKCPILQKIIEKSSSLKWDLQSVSQLEKYA